MKLVWTAVFVLGAAAAYAQPAPEAPRPSQQMVGQLATALAASQDREADLRAQVMTLQADVAKLKQPQPSPESPKKP